MWMGAVNWANHWFRGSVILCGDAPAITLLRDTLLLPFVEVIELPDYPEDLSRIYELPKLFASNILAKRGCPHVHFDSDAILRKRLPPSMLAAGFVTELVYPRDVFIDSINAMLPIKRLHRHAPCISTAITGGNDLASIVAYTDESIRVAFHNLNRPTLMDASLTGYILSVILGEAAAGEAFADDVVALVAEPCRKDLCESAGWFHAADAKRTPGGTSELLSWISYDFPEDVRRIYHCYDKLHGMGLFSTVESPVDGAARQV